MRTLITFLLIVLLPLSAFVQGSVTISGRITDKVTGVPLQGATISIKNETTSTLSNNYGVYLISNLKAGKVVIVVSYVGFQQEVLTITTLANSSNNVDFDMSQSFHTGDEVVVSASKRKEKITNAPTSIKVIGIKDIDEFAGSNMTELYAKIEGLEYTRTGVDQISINARGFNNAFNSKFLQMTDGRISMSPGSGGLPMGNRTSVNKYDIERLEVLLGPQSALYGPNAHNGLANTITKDPRKYSGTTIGVSVGSQNQFSTRFRLASVINKKWAYKLTGEYATGQEYIFYDSVYGAGGGVYGPAMSSIPEHNVDFRFKNLRGEAQIYYSVSPKTDIILTAGGNNSSFTQVTTSGNNQMRGLTSSFIQARMVNARYFINVYKTWGTLGTSYLRFPYTRDYWNRTHSTITNCQADPNRCKLSPEAAEAYALRLGNQFKEENQRLNAELQYNYHFEKIGLSLVTGLTYQKDDPNAYGITLLDSAQRISITQTGAVLQLEKTLPWNLRFVAAGRLDHHSKLGNFFSPKLALVKKVGEGSFRLTWAKAYSMPSILFQYSKIGNTTFGNGAGIVYIPNGTNASSMNDTSLYKSTTPLKPEEVATWEIGYKGTIANKLYIDIDYYNGMSKNFLGTSQRIEGLAKYTGEGIKLNPTNKGEVINGLLQKANFNTYFNYSEVRVYGLDLALNYYFNKVVNLGFKYSWFGSDITSDDIKNDANGDGYVSKEETSMNAPAHRFIISLGLDNLCKGKAFVNLSARYLQSYEFYSGVQIGTEAGEGKRGYVYRGKPYFDTLYKNFDHGPVGGFLTFNLNAGYKMNENVSLVMGITNMLNTKQVEFVGSPSIGRLVSFEIKIHVPESKKNRQKPGETR